jgi:hypothetical protein
MVNLGMKALSGYAEWFWLMAKNIKPVENRTWPLSRYIKSWELPARIYLHASKKPANQDDIGFIREMFLHGYISAKQWVEYTSVDWQALRDHIIGEITITGDWAKHFSLWAFGPHIFTVQDGILYAHPIPCKGRLGFFEPDIDVQAELRKIEKRQGA